uniref:Uncharacterized protein n=1 Tax=Panagrolaimus sp. ES5 TaxID=591445 RepID=A0AC34FEV4_9BILA
MKTKGDYVPFKHKQIEFANNAFNGQYNNLNLNQNRQHLFEENIWSKSVTSDKRKVQNWDYNDLRVKENSTLWKKSNKNLSSSFMNLDYSFGKKDKFKKKESSITQSSTLALHIACYENTMEAEADSESAEKEDLKDSKKGLIKKWDISKQFLSGLSSPNIQNPFEFPRQQESEEARQPEVVQFKASQKLLDPKKCIDGKNQADASNVYRQKLRHYAAGDGDASNVNPAQEVFEPLLSRRYDRILLRNQTRNDDDLLLKEVQIDKIFKCLQQSAGNSRILYLSVAQIHSDSVLPSLQNVDIIVSPFPGTKNGHFVLAVFNLTTKIPWRFLMEPNHKYRQFKKMKEALETKIKAQLGPDFKFENDKTKRDCDRLIVKRTDSYNDGILVCRAAEDIFFTGWVKLWDPFDVNDERERYQRIFDILNNDWDGVWPARLDCVSSSLDESDNDSETPSENTNVDGDDSFDINASSQASNVDEDAPIPINSDPLIDFDDRHSPPPFDHNPHLGDASSLVNAGNQASNIVEGGSIPVDDDQPDNFAGRQSPPPVVAVEDAAEEPLSVNTSSSSDYYAVSLDTFCQPGYSPPSSPPREPQNSVIRNQQPETSFIVRQDWKLQQIRERPFFVSTTADASSEDEEDNGGSWQECEEKCCTIITEMRNYWECVQELVDARQKIVAVLDQKLSKDRYYSKDEVARMNARIENLEQDLNAIIPVTPKWKAKFQKDSNKNIVIRKGFIYKKVDRSENTYRCTFKYLFNWCCSYIVIDDAGNLLPGSFCDHFHPGFEEYTDDEPPAAILISLPRIISPSVIPWPVPERKFSKMVKFLEEKSLEIFKWRSQISLCLENAKLIQRYMADLQENADEFVISRSKGICTKMIVMEANNLFKCIRLEKTGS